MLVLIIRSYIRRKRVGFYKELTLREKIEIILII